MNKSSNMSRRNFLTAGLALLASTGTLSVLSGCADSNESSAADPASSVQQGDADSNESIESAHQGESVVDNANSNELLALTDIADREPDFYVLDASGAVRKIGSSVYYPEQRGSSMGFHGLWFLSGTNDVADTIRVGEGESLITTWDRSEFTLYPVDNSVVYLVSADWSRYEEINGIPYEEESDLDVGLFESGITKVQLGNYIYYYISSEPTSVKVGFYSGTQWNEETLYFDQSCSISRISDNKLVDDIAPVIKTKAGYFIVDLSQITKGEYLLQVPKYDNQLYKITVL